MNQFCINQSKTKTFDLFKIRFLCAFDMNGEYPTAILENNLNKDNSDSLLLKYITKNQIYLHKLRKIAVN